MVHLLLPDPLSPLFYYGPLRLRKKKGYRGNGSATKVLYTYVTGAMCVGEPDGRDSRENDAE